MTTTIRASAPIAEKVDDTRFRITQTRTTTNVENVVSVYTINELTEQRANIVAQRDAQIAELQKLKTEELAKVDAFLAQAEKLGIKAEAEIEK